MNAVWHLGNFEVSFVQHFNTVRKDRMDRNIYSAPEADLNQDSANEKEFYVVSKKKFLVLYFGTGGIYALYWFYRQWRGYKRARGKKILPVMRAIFSVIFVYPLFKKIQQGIEEKGVEYKWPFVVAAVVYIISDLLGWASMFAPVGTLFYYLSLLLLPISAWPLFQAQKAANLACDDIGGLSNASFTSANALWLVIGAFIWVFAIIAYVALHYFSK